MNRTFAVAGILAVVLVGCTGAAAQPSTEQVAALSSPEPVATPKPTPKPTPQPTPEPVEPLSAAEITAAVATEDCLVITDNLNDEERVAATTDVAVLEVAADALSRCLTGEYVAPTTVTPFKKWATIGDWDVRIIKVDHNAAKALKKANMFNDPIPRNMVAVMIYVEAKYNGTGRESLSPGSIFRAVGPAGIEYSTFQDPTCGVMPEPNIRLNDKTLRHGGTIKGWGACFVVEKSDAAELVAFAMPMFSFDDSEIVEFALR